MIRLSLPKDPCWVDLPHGVRVFVRPLTMAIYEAARAKGARLASDLAGEHAGIVMAGGSVETPGRLVSAAAPQPKPLSRNSRVRCRVSI